MRPESRAIMEEKRVQIISGVKISRALSLIHLLFVDDGMLFSNGSLRELESYRKYWQLIVLLQVWNFMCKNFQSVLMAWSKRQNKG